MPNEGRVFVVTGGRGRIGAAIADALTTRGDRVVVIDRKSVPDSSATKPSTSAVHLIADLAEEQSAAAAFTQAQDTWGRIDGAVLCAGSFVYESHTAITTSTFDQLFRDNVLTAFHAIKALAAPVAAAGAGEGGTIVFMGTIVDHRVVKGNAVYGASKAALRMMCDVVREELKQTNVRLTNLCLGAVASPMSAQLGQRADLVDVRHVIDSTLWLLDRAHDVRFDELRLFPSVGVNDA